MAGLEDLRSLASSLARGAGRAAYARAPGPVREALDRAQTRFEERRTEARRTLEDLASIEQHALELASKIVIFPWATAGAIQELYVRVKELERTVESRDQAIARLEARVRDLERRTT